MRKHEEKRPFGNVDVDVRTILKWILETGWEDVDGFDLAQDRDKLLAGVNTVTNLLFLLNAGNSLPAEEMFVGISRRVLLYASFFCSATPKIGPRPPYC